MSKKQISNEILKIKVLKILFASGSEKRPVYSTHKISRSIKGRTIKFDRMKKILEQLAEKRLIVKIEVDRRIYWQISDEGRNSYLDIAKGFRLIGYDGT
ncbi:MAG: hypothetical protein ACFE95_07655 [Candidatus Hodarchaeota archaeon]